MTANIEIHEGQGALPDTTDASSLRSALERSTGLAREAVDLARSLSPQLVTELVAVLIERELSRPSADGTATRAAYLAHALGLTGVVPVLARCVDGLALAHPLRDAALAALSRVGPAGTEALLRSFEVARSGETRAGVAEALARTPADDDRVRGALVRLLDEDPLNGARLLATRGEWAAVPDLHRALDRFILDPLDDCAARTSEHLRAIARAVRYLGGALTEEERASIDDVFERRDMERIELEDMLDALAIRRGAATALRRPGRNDPCPCGSGKKYKKCHLSADEGDASQ